MDYYSRMAKLYADILDEYGITQSIVDDVAEGEMFNLLYDYDLWDEYGHSQSYENFYAYLMECADNTLEMTRKEVFELLDVLSYRMDFKTFLRAVETFGLGIDFGVQSFEELMELVSNNARAFDNLKRMLEEDIARSYGLFFDDSVYDSDFLDEVYYNLKA